MIQDWNQDNLCSSYRQFDVADEMEVFVLFAFISPLREFSG